jgi:Fe-S-cluster containining protein
MRKNTFGRTKGFKGIDKPAVKQESAKQKKAKVNKALKKRANLKTFLQSVYQDNINLETTCEHNLCCCKVAMPSMNYCEFVQIATDLWKDLDREQQIEIILKSLQYFFMYDYEKWHGDSLIKPCMFLNGGKKICEIYENRPLNCRLYGLWPKDIYERRVDKFEKVYERYGLKREELPLNKQCPFVKRKNEDKPITEEVINDLFKKLDDMDFIMENFTKLQISQKENYRTFHDWLLLKIFGEDWLTKLTTFIMAADKTVMELQLIEIQKALKEQFLKTGVPDIDLIGLNKV